VWVGVLVGVTGVGVGVGVMVGGSGVGDFIGCFVVVVGVEVGGGETGADVAVRGKGALVVGGEAVVGLPVGPTPGMPP